MAYDPCPIGLGFCPDESGAPDYGRPCSQDADCVAETRCKIVSSAERCVARGGIVGTRASCCPECAPSPQTPCGPELRCDATSELCMIRGPVGPGVIHTCEPIPAGCESDRTCGCAATSLCQAPFDTCHDVEGPGDAIFCECLMCQ